MKDSRGKVIYVGKAKNLYKRVSSYFQKGAYDTKTMQMIAQVADIEITVTNSDYEAFLLESTLIKKYKPRYNILFKDDKSYPYLVLTNHGYPRLMGYRGNAEHLGKVFGPYVSFNSMKDNLALLQKIFKLRQCRDSYFNARTRPCLQYQIHRCSAPCVGYISKKDYHEQVKLLEKFLNGHLSEVLENLKAKMQHASDNEAYESAAHYRDQIITLRKLQQQQAVENQGEGLVDVFGIAYKDHHFAIDLLQLNNGTVISENHWFVKHFEETTIKEVLEAFLAQYYLTTQSHRLWPDQVILPRNIKTDKHLLTNINQKAEKTIQWLHQPRSNCAKVQKLAYQNAIQKLKLETTSQMNYRKQLATLAKLFNHNHTIERIECFDISHFQGEARQASCVVFNHEGISKPDYRKFNIKNGQAKDDYAGIYEAVYRRFKHQQNVLPDLLIIDGGLGQLNAAFKALQAHDLHKRLKVLSLAKGQSRIAGRELIYYDAYAEPVNLIEHDPAFLLLRHIRDEAHRFAIKGQRNKMAKKRSHSVLEQIPGIGPKRKKALLQHFGGWQELEKASSDEIAKIPGISQRLADFIWQHFRQ